MPTISARNLIDEAMIAAGQLAQGETASAADASYGLSLLNRMLETWNTRRMNVYAIEFADRTLTPNLNPHLIGPTGSTGFVVAQRPVKVPAAQLVLNTSTPNVLLPINIRDKDWYASLGIPALTSTFPTDLYYQPAWPHGKLYFYPVGTVAYAVRLHIWTLLSQLANLNADVTLPPGYHDVLTFNLALKLCIGQKAPDAVLVDEARRALAAIQGVNTQAPRISTQDFGMPTSGDRKTWNWRTGGS